MAHQAGAYPGFSNRKRLGVFLLPLDGMLVYLRVNRSIKFAGTHLFTRVERGKVSCARTKTHVSPAKAQTQTSRSGGERTTTALCYSMILLHLTLEVILSENIFFTITAEILARSLANFYRQYADRHMNLKFVRRVSERERAIRPFVIVKNKLMSVFTESVLLLTMNFVITLSK